MGIGKLCPSNESPLPHSVSPRGAMVLLGTIALAAPGLIAVTATASARVPSPPQVSSMTIRIAAEDKGTNAAPAATRTWPSEELRKIVEADDLHISPFRDDGVTYGTPTWIWSVAVDGCLYLRAYNGRNSRWYQAAVRQKAERIIAAGMTREVSFELVDGPLNDRIDDAYLAKYHGSSYLNPMISARARAATVRIVPREGGS
jgi:hypothetical protein